MAQVRRVIHTREGVDIVLLFLGDAARFLSVVLDFWARYLPTALGKLRIPTALSSKLATGGNIAATQAHVSRLLPIIEEWAIVNRLWGVLDSVVATKELVTGLVDHRRKGEPVATADEALATVNLVATMSFNICEASSWLAAKGILSWSPQKQETFMYAAARSWAVTTCVDLTRTLIGLYKVTKTANKDKGESSSLRNKLCVDVAWVAVMLHWSVRGGLYPDVVASILSVFSSFGTLKEVWKETA
jgi:hypothetical protein